MKIYDNSNNLLAIVIRNDDIRQGKNFVTNDDNEFQLAAFSLDKGEKIAELVIKNKEEIIKTLPLYATDDLKKVNFFKSLITSINFLIWGDA